MKIILLSGGSGKRLWPLSNDTRSKQFLKVLESPNGGRESMIQRVVRMIIENNLTKDIIISTGANQKDIIEIQLGKNISIVAEPSRRDTFPAIALACSYLATQNTSYDEPIIVMPCDSFTEDSYFKTIEKMANACSKQDADIILMGIKPYYPSSKYGYILPVKHDGTDRVMKVARFTEKPDTAAAEKLIQQGAMWNGGVFAFKLGYILQILNQYLSSISFDEVRRSFDNLPPISFDYEIVEKATSVAVVEYDGIWKDLGTWNILTEELKDKSHGNVITYSCDSSYIINEFDIPVVCMGISNAIIAATPDGILISDIEKSEKLKDIVTPIKRPMYERRRWGKYQVIDYIEYPDGYCALTKRITLNQGKKISYQRHAYRSEVWTIIDGEGELVLGKDRKCVKRGDTIVIEKLQMHTLRAITPLTFIEVQFGKNLIEEDIE